MISSIPNLTMKNWSDHISYFTNILKTIIWFGLQQCCCHEYPTIQKQIKRKKLVAKRKGITILKKWSYTQINYQELTKVCSNYLYQSIMQLKFWLIYGSSYRRWSEIHCAMVHDGICVCSNIWIHKCKQLALKKAYPSMHQHNLSPTILAVSFILLSVHHYLIFQIWRHK